MKYRVVGWTDYDSDEVEGVDCNSFAERNAIIDEIRKKKYFFSGFDHQEMWNCVPVLNDGKKRWFSQRGWGGVMAEAYNHNGKYDYSLFAFGTIPNKASYPYDEFEKDKFIPETNLNETFEVVVPEDIFNFAKTKNPFFMDDLEELRFIDKNDTLILKCGENILNFTIADIDRNRNIIRSDRTYDYVINTKIKLIVTHT